MRKETHVGLHEEMSVIVVWLQPKLTNAWIKHKFYENSFTYSRFVTCVLTYDDSNMRIVFSKLANTSKMANFNSLDFLKHAHHSNAFLYRCSFPAITVVFHRQYTNTHTHIFLVLVMQLKSAKPHPISHFHVFYIIHLAQKNASPYICSMNKSNYFYCQ
jgi:hypothetical protein